MADTALQPTALIARNKWADDRKTIWGNSYTWSWVRPWSQLQGILIHHSVTTHTATANDIALLHKARGWAGIGYHFVITKDGVVHYVGDISTARAHVLDKNEKFLGVCMVGDFTKHLPSDDQIISAHDLVKYFLTEVPSIPTLNNWNQLGGHKDQQATACPGTSWPNDMRERIVNRTPYTALPTPTPEPEPPTNDLYSVLHKGVQLGAFVNNPITTIETLQAEIASLKESNANNTIDQGKLQQIEIIRDALGLPASINTSDALITAINGLIEEANSSNGQNGTQTVEPPEIITLKDGSKWKRNGLQFENGKLTGNYDKE